MKLWIIIYNFIAFYKYLYRKITFAILIHSFVVFKKKVDYHGPPNVSLSNDDAGAPAPLHSSHPARPGVVFKKEGWLPWSTSCLSLMQMRERLFCCTHPTDQTRRHSLQALTAIIFSATLLYHGNTRGLSLKNWAPRTSSLEADICRAEMQSSKNI